MEYFITATENFLDSLKWSLDRIRDDLESFEYSCDEQINKYFEEGDRDNPNIKLIKDVKLKARVFTRKIIEYRADFLINVKSEFESAGSNELEIDY